MTPSRGTPDAPPPHSRPRHRGRPVCLLVALTPASAHVTVTRPGATRGGSDRDHVPGADRERHADTTGLKVQLPTDTPIASVWCSRSRAGRSPPTTTKLATPITTDDGDITEAVSEIDWTADRRPPRSSRGSSASSRSSPASCPTSRALTFKAIQTYSDGSVVRWIETSRRPGTQPSPSTRRRCCSWPRRRTASGSVTPARRPSATAAARRRTSDGSSNTGPIVLSIVALVRGRRGAGPGRGQPGPGRGAA